MKPWQIVRSFKSLKWLLTLKRACSSAYAKFASNSSRPTHRRDYAIDDREGGEAVGVMKLGEEVSECKYSDVHVMWSILKESENLHRQQQAAAMALAMNHHNRRYPRGIHAN